MRDTDTGCTQVDYLITFLRGRQVGVGRLPHSTPHGTWERQRQHGKSEGRKVGEDG